MKISAVQLQPATGNIESNIAKHLALIDAAVQQGADLVFFPELSLTGYEPTLAQALVIDKADARLGVFQQRSDEHHLFIGVSLPLSVELGVQIGMIWFTPDRPRRSYAKQQLHADELPFFVAGEEQLILEIPSEKIAPAICYESLQPGHAKQAAELGASVYLASVAKPAGGMQKGVLHYPKIAEQHNMCVIMADSVGPCDNFVSVGQSAAWNRKGALLAQMDSQSEGFLLVDTVDESAVVCKLRGV